MAEPKKRKTAIKRFYLFTFWILLSYLLFLGQCRILRDLCRHCYPVKRDKIEDSLSLSTHWAQNPFFLVPSGGQWTEKQYLPVHTWTVCCPSSIRWLRAPTCPCYDRQELRRFQQVTTGPYSRAEIRASRINC